jgi:hypothetical protein
MYGPITPPRKVIIFTVSAVGIWLDGPTRIGTDSQHYIYQYRCIGFGPIGNLEEAAKWELYSERDVTVNIANSGYIEAVRELEVVDD